MAIDLGGIERKAASALNEVTKATGEIIENTVNDVNLILRGIGDCAKAMDAIRVRVTQRAIEYQTKAARILTDASVLPVEIIEQVYRTIAGQLQGNPNPKIYKLNNPEDFAWYDSMPRYALIDPNTFRLNPQRAPYIFIHGIEHGTLDSALGFYYNFENSARMFQPLNNNNIYKTNADIYVVTYDATLSGDHEQIIRKAFSSVLGSTAIGNAPQLFTAVMWREWERRATITADRVLFPFYQRIFSNQVPPIGGVISHSLGCFVAARAAQRFMTEQPNARPLLDKWLCMAAALPSSAFTNTGVFKDAPLIAGVPSLTQEGTSVWYSWADLVLSTAYYYANNHPAMGQTGALTPLRQLFDFNVTSYVGTVHDADPTDLNSLSKSYFGRLSQPLGMTFSTR